MPPSSSARKAISLASRIRSTVRRAARHDDSKRLSIWDWMSPASASSDADSSATSRRYADGR